MLVLFPGLFLLCKLLLKRAPFNQWGEADAVLVSARYVCGGVCLCVCVGGGACVCVCVCVCAVVRARQSVGRGRHRISQVCGDKGSSCVTLRQRLFECYLLPLQAWPQTPGTAGAGAPSGITRSDLEIRIASQIAINISLCVCVCVCVCVFVVLFTVYVCVC